MSYTKVFTKPYASGYKDLPSQTTPITATTLNAKDTAITHIEEYLEDNPIGSDVEWNQITESGTKIAEITIGEEVTEVYAPTGGSGGSSSASDISYDNTETSMEATNVQDALDEVFQSVSNGKELIADAITDKGIETSATDTFQTMATNIGNISGGSSVELTPVCGYVTRGSGSSSYSISGKNIAGVKKIYFSITVWASSPSTDTVTVKFKINGGTEFTLPNVYKSIAGSDQYYQTRMYEYELSDATTITSMNVSISGYNYNSYTNIGSIVLAEV